MFPVKFLLYALALELSAWAGLLLGIHSDEILLLFLLSHGSASAMIALTAHMLLPKRMAEPRPAVLLFLFGMGFTVPLLGFAGAIGGAYYLRALYPHTSHESFVAVELPEIDPHHRNAKGFHQAGIRTFLTNPKVSATGRLRALVALQNLPGRVASHLLRDVLTDPSEDVRLLAYGMLDTEEKLLNEAIHRELARLQEAPEDSLAHLDATHRLADLYWELIYQDLVQGDLHAHALQQSLAYTTSALAREPEDAALHLRHGRLLQAQGQPRAASIAYDKSLKLGMPKTKIVPYLAEVAYDLRDYDSVHTLMEELGEWQSLPRLKPVISYWSQT